MSQTYEVAKGRHLTKPQTHVSRDCGYPTGYHTFVLVAHLHPLARPCHMSPLPCPARSLVPMLAAVHFYLAFQCLSKTGQQCLCRIRPGERLDHDPKDTICSSISLRALLSMIRVDILLPGLVGAGSSGFCCINATYPATLSWEAIRQSSQLVVYYFWTTV